MQVSDQKSTPTSCQPSTTIWKRLTFNNDFSKGEIDLIVQAKVLRRTLWLQQMEILKNFEFGGCGFVLKDFFYTILPRTKQPAISAPTGTFLLLNLRNLSLNIESTVLYECVH